jgi:exonuclease SbcC
MIPVKLNLRNFMCYTDAHEPLEFDGIHVACLSGANGHGKSALLDAMTWALWGRSRAQRDDDLVSLGGAGTEMEVEFEFRLGAEQYRVIRKRNKRGRGQSMLELAVRQADGEYRALTGNNLRETERQVEGLLRMSYETFTNSSFILQGRADSFTTRTPNERKQVLAEILDLSYYDRLEERARRLAAERTEQQTVLQTQIREDDAELQQQPELKVEQGRLEAELGALEERLKLEEAHCEALRERVSRLKANQRELEEQAKRLHDARTRADRYRQQAATAQAALGRALAVLAREAEIEQGWTALTERRKEIEQLGMAQAEHGRLTYEVQCQLRIIDQERGRLEGRQKQIGAQVAILAAEAARLERHRDEREAARADLATLEQEETRRQTLESDIAEAREQFAAAKANGQQHQRRLEELRQKQSLLADSPTCPVCRTALGADGHRDVLGQYRREEEQVADLARRDERQMAEVERRGKALRAVLATLADLPERRKAAHARHSKAEAALARAEEQASSLEQLRREVGEIERALSANDYAHAERAEIVTLERQVMSLGYDEARHKAASAAALELARFEQERQELLDARRSEDREREAKAEAEQALAEWEGEARAAEERRAELQAETKDLPAAESEWTSAETALREHRRRQVDLSQQLGGVHQRLSTMDFVAQRRAERRAELQRVLSERSIYQQLVEAFGKKGLQALLIETAIPEIEDEANGLLDVLTDGRMRVAFKTQRAARVGDNQIETLDIIIRDELGERPYEMYSGGEAFRVNFAIRIALSKLLARRAGAKLQTLVIDEGFGSQDEQGRDRLVDAIRTIQPEFEKILIITHMTDLKDLFPTRIEVTKTPAGSVIEVT